VEVRGRLHGKAALTWIHVENGAGCQFVGEKKSLVPDENEVTK